MSERARERARVYARVRVRARKRSLDEKKRKRSSLKGGKLFNNNDNYDHVRFIQRLRRSFIVS